MTVQEIMNSDVITIHEDVTIHEVFLLIQQKKVTDHTAEMLLRDMVLKQVDVESHGAGRIYEEDTLEKAIKEVLGTNSKAILDYKSGKEEAFNFLVGQVMRKTQGRGDPDSIRALKKKMI